MLREGQRVTSLGSTLAQAGSTGVVLALADHGSAHVQWHEGAQAGQVTLESELDLAPLSQRESLLDDSLDLGHLVTTSAREVYDDGGPAGLLNQMSEDGHLAAFASIAEEAVAFISGRIRVDASFRAVCGQLEPEEGESLIRLASFALIRDAFTADE